MKNIILSVLILSVQGVFCKNIPSYVHLCKRNDPQLSECFIKTLNEIRPYLIKGIPEMNIPPGDPLYYMNVTAETGHGTSVTLEVHSWDQVATGILDFEIKKLVVDLDRARCSTLMTFPKLRLQGKYQFKGKVLLLAIDTIGTFDINSTNFEVGADYIGKYYEKNGKKHIEFEKIVLNMTPGKNVVYFDNLINGNAEMTRSLNTAVNKNIDALRDELDPLIEQTFGGLAREYFNRVFRMYSVDELFPLQ